MASHSDSGDRLDSWKEIAAYVGRNVRTVIRWEQTRGFPVHRVPGGQRQAVYAWRYEIDAWLRKGEDKAEEAVDPVLAAQPGSSPPARPASQPLTEQHGVRQKIHWAAAGLSLAAILGTTAFAVHSLTAPLHLELTDITALTSDATQKSGLVTGGGQVYFGEVKDGRNIVFSVPAGGGPARSIPTPLANAKPEYISPDGKELLVLAWEGMEEERELWIVPVASGKPRRIGTLLCHAAAWSPDGNTIAYAYGNSIYVTKDQGVTSQKLQSFAGSPQILWWFPEGKSLRVEVRDSRTDHGAIWDLRLMNRDGAEVASLVPLMFCADEHAQTVVEAIRAAACTGNPGDGLIAVSELADVLRIRSGERGDAAL